MKVNTNNELDACFKIIDDAARSLLDERLRYEAAGEKLSEIEFVREAIRLGIILSSGFACPGTPSGRLQ